MAQIATQSDVSALEREGGARVVVERGGFPIHYVVAHHAIGRELCHRMRRIGRCIIILQVTGNAFRADWVEPKT